jgi:DnaJ family protein B protein 12
MECLSDAAKREVYDQYGGTENEGYSQAAGRGGGGNPFGRHPQEMSPEELFNLFFQGGMGGHPAFRAQFGGQRQQQQQQQQPQQQSFINQILSFLPIILLFLMSFSQSSSPAERVYSFAPDHVYRVHRETKMAGVAKDIHYYVNDRFRQKYGKSTADMYRVEKAVEREFRELKLGSCYQEEQSKARRLNRARWDRRPTEEIQGIQSEPAPSCDEYRSVFGEEPRFN